jgi:electron transfer flavoprotein alpha subunit/electron transfer flavoprotein alpha/beta subunit
MDMTSAERPNMDGSGDRQPGLRIATLVKQVPARDALELDGAGLLRRVGDMEMNAFCRRAVKQSVLLAEATGGRSVVFTMGPPSALDVLREAVACGIDSAVHLCDVALSGSDTLVTARALARAIEREGPFDLVLVGRSSSDSSTASIGPQVAAFLDLPFVGPVRSLRLAAGGDAVDLELELDDATEHVRVQLPAVLSTAERLCKGASSPCEDWPDIVPVRRYAAAELGPGPWGVAGSPTRVAAVRPRPRQSPGREVRMLSGTLTAQVRAAVDLLTARGAFDGYETIRGTVPATHHEGPAVVAVMDGSMDVEARALLGAAAELASRTGGHVVAVAGRQPHIDVLGSWGADRVVVAAHRQQGAVADALARWCRTVQPWAVLATADTWGQEILSRLAVALRAGLVTDALGFGLRDGRLVGVRAAFGGEAVVEIDSTSAVQCATVCPGALPLLAPRWARPRLEWLDTVPDERMKLLSRRVNDVSGALGRANTVVGVGLGVAPDEYPLLRPLLDTLGAELGGTRKVTDRGWLPHGRQIGTTGRLITPRLYIALGISGAAEHVAGIRHAGSIMAVNLEAGSPIFAASDVGIVADWRDVAPLLVEYLPRRLLAAS